MKIKLDELQKQAKKIYRDWQTNLSYKDKLQIRQESQRSIDFYEGRQYIGVKKKLPFEKPVFNLVEFIVDSKLSNILSKQWTYNFIVNNSLLSTKNVSDFAKFQVKEMGLQKLNRKAVLDGLLKGTFIYLFYWDENAVGELGSIKGALKCDILDINDIAVANPMERDIQKQKWVMYRSIETLEAVKEMCNTLSEEQKKEYIKADGSSRDKNYSTSEIQDNEELCTVYIKMWKQDNEVYFQKFTKDIALTLPLALNPKVNRKAKEIEKEEQEESNNTYEEDLTNRKSMETNKQKPDEEIKIKANLYPIEMGFFRDREGSCYGRSDVIQIIPNNKLINQEICMNMLYTMKTSINTWLVKKGALGTQKIDVLNPGQVIEDNTTNPAQWGIQQVTNQAIPTTSYELANSIFELTKNVTRATDVLTSEVVSKDLSGTAISQLQGQQDKPIEQYQNSLWESLERIGKILEMFYKLFYHKTRYTIEATKEEKEIYASATNQEEYLNEVLLKEGEFNGEDYLNTPFTVQVEVGEGSRYSELMTLQILTDFYKSGTYSNLTTDQKIQYFTMLDRNMFSKRDEMLRLLDAEKKGIIAQLQEENAKLQKQIEQQALNMQSLYEEFTNKINIYNGELDNLRNSINSLQKKENNNLLKVNNISQ